MSSISKVTNSQELAASMAASQNGIASSNASVAATKAYGSAAVAKGKTEVAAVAQKFEAIFNRQMLSEMRKASLSDDDLFGNDAGDQFRDMQDAKLAENLSGHSGPHGISAMLMQQMGGQVATDGTATTNS
ncbi:MAG: rod-binding protein [Zymomonas mobilis]|uniref:Flagellar protein FlgJ n=1 Tax=Zymomonas mobilis TaxID=542 RepID=A0A542W0H1_ZYMMB|nr:rod-binding protein [Zymomonas mobilis]TQL17075.1 flagellar protein FlgJ [Zymomonas mobilis]